MRDVQAYLQHIDFEVERLGLVELPHALDLLEDFPGDEERTDYILAGEQGQAVAPPALGFEGPAGEHVEITWFPDQWVLTFAARRAVKLLGLLPASPRRDERIELTARDEARWFVRQFYQEGDEEIWRRIDQYE
jgi:hypothetical protein